MSSSGTTTPAVESCPGIRHGSHRLRLVTPDVHEVVSGEENAYVLREWVNHFGDVPAELEADLQQEVTCTEDRRRRRTVSARS
ncbi:hypothetical protein ACWGI1_34710 [Streptomyces sp. NPDC054835]